MKPPRIAPRTFAYVIRQYLNSPKFDGLSRATREAYARYLRIAAHPDSLGSVPVAEMRPALVQAFLDGLADRPSVQGVAKTAIKSVERWAVVRDMLPGSITLGTEILKREGGHKPWTDEQVAHAEAHCAPHLARVITLAANTGQRGSDLVRMRWTDIEDVDGHPGINVVQQKTGLKLWVPFTTALQAAISTWRRQDLGDRFAVEGHDGALGHGNRVLGRPVGHGETGDNRNQTRSGPGAPSTAKLPTFILLMKSGHPWTRAQLSNAWVEERERNRALEPIRDAGLVLHGLRGTAVVRLRRAGATLPQIGDMVGMSQPMVARYCRYSVQKENALAAVYRLDRTAIERAREKKRDERG